MQVQQAGAVLGGHPQHPGVVHRQPVHAVRAQAHGHQRVVVDVPAAAGLRVQQLQTAAHGGDPHPARRVVGDAADGRPGQGVGVVGVVDEVAEGAGLRVEEVQALDLADPQAAAPVQVQPVDGVVVAGCPGRRGRRAPAFHGAGARVDAAEAGVGAGPHAAVGAQGQGPDVVRGDRAGLVLQVLPAGEGRVGRLEAEQAVLAGGQPDAPLAVDGQVLDLVGVQAGGCPRIPAEVHEALAGGVEVAEARPLGAEPDAPVAVLAQAPHAVAADAGGVVGVVLEDADRVPVVAVQPVLGGEPDETLAVLEHVVDHALGQAVPGGDPLEAGRVLEAGRGPGGRQTANRSGSQADRGRRCGMGASLSGQGPAGRGAVGSPPADGRDRAGPSPVIGRRAASLSLEAGWGSSPGCVGPADRRQSAGGRSPPGRPGCC